MCETCRPLSGREHLDHVASRAAINHRHRNLFPLLLVIVSRRRGRRTFCCYQKASLVISLFLFLVMSISAVSCLRLTVESNDTRTTSALTSRCVLGMMLFCGDREGLAGVGCRRCPHSGKVRIDTCSGVLATSRLIKA